MLGTSNAWLVVRLDKGTTVQSYYFINCRILNQVNQPFTTTVKYPFVYSWNVYVMLPELAVETGTPLDWSLSSFPSGL